MAGDLGGRAMRTQQVAAFLLGIGGGLAIAWIVEAVFVGRGVVSTYLGPVALLAIFTSMLIRRRAG
jgi:hypothetical protein